MTRQRMIAAWLLALAWGPALHAQDKPAAPASLKWNVRLLALDANEGCSVADFDGDGKPDISAGRFWFRNPDWAPRPLRAIEDWQGYVQSNGEHAIDVNGDGKVDIVSGSFLPTALNWYENPGPQALTKGQLWPQRLLVDTGQSSNEMSLAHDLDGDGKPEILVNSWIAKNPVLAWKITRDKDNKPAAQRLLIGSSQNSHGMGVGDINNDGREDILTSTGWFERPSGDAFAQPWTFHADWNLPHASVPMIVTDVDRDGRNDLIWGNGHNFGVYWWQAKAPEPSGKLAFNQVTIDKSYSQAHALAWADLDGDGKPELIAGMRKWAHNGKDPGDDQPPQLCYYTYDPNAKAFSRHVIEQGNVGCGLQIRVADVNGDGKPDIVVAGKTGTYLLTNLGK